MQVRNGEHEAGLRTGRGPCDGSSTWHVDRALAFLALALPDARGGIVRDRRLLPRRLDSPSETLAIDQIGPVVLTTKVSVSMLLLASLLLNAGLGVKIGQVRDVLKSPGILGLGMAANLVVPIGFILVVSRFMGGWHNADEVQNILVGLALVASMPIAGFVNGLVSKCGRASRAQPGTGPPVDSAQSPDDAGGSSCRRLHDIGRLRRRPS